MTTFAAAIASAILLIIRSAAEDLRGRHLLLPLAWFLLALYLQFFSGAPVLRMAGVVLQTLLALYLLLNVTLGR